MMILFLFIIVGETTNLMAIDSQKFMDMVLLINIIWSSPLQIALAMYFLWDILGASSLAGMYVKIQIIYFNTGPCEGCQRNHWN